MTQTILLAYDGSDTARAALAVAVRLQRALVAGLYLVHVVASRHPPMGMAPDMGQTDLPATFDDPDSLSAQTMAEARCAIQTHGGHLSKSFIGRGDPADFILLTAQDIDADLIVLGRRRLGALGARAFGSVSLPVVREAPCPCLTVP